MPAPLPLIPTSVRFGIKNLDMLLGRPDETFQYGYGKGPEKRFSMTISGRHGLGKSVMALHAISDYASRACNSANRDKSLLCLYISTDLSYEKASETWRKFGLDYPLLRQRKLYGERDTEGRLGFQMPLYRVAPSAEWLEDPADRAEINGTTPIDLSKTAVLSDVLAADNLPAGVAFLDLESMTGGDDWSLVTNIIAALRPKIKKSLHFVVIDALEGLSFLNPDSAAVSSNAMLRSQIEQMLRDAKDTAHLLMVSEASKKGEDAAENYVADIVVRLAHEPLGERYLAKTVSIEKTRSQGHISGKHTLLVRNGQAGSTGLQPHYDEPEKRLNRLNMEHMAYVDVFHSIDFVDTKFRRKSAVGETKELSGRLQFGIHYLDDLLGGAIGVNGVKCGTVTAIIGSPKTYKSLLAYHFLAQAFIDLPKSKSKLIIKDSVNPYSASTDTPELLTAKYESFWHFRRIFDRQIKTNKIDVGFALLFTTLNYDSRQLTDRMTKLLGYTSDPDIRALIEQRTVCRRLELQTLSSSGFYNIIEATLTALLQRLHDAHYDWRNSSQEQKQLNSTVRVVIDNWAAVIDTYPEVANDPLLLPNILALFRRTGVTGIIVESQSQETSHPQAMLVNSKLSRFVDHVINTWTVAIDDRKVVAISHAGVHNETGSTLIRELKLFRNTERGVYVDPELELYAGLEEGEIKRVPLRIRLFTESISAETYADQLNTLFKRMFVPQSELDGNVVSSSALNKSGNMSERYELLQSSVRLHRGHLKETIVWQVSEFWSLPRTSADDIAPSLTNLSRYIDGPVFKDTWDKVIEQELSDIHDPYGVFRPTSGLNIPNNIDRIRSDYYPTPNLSGGENPRDRYPYIWDFGFLSLQDKVWEQAKTTLALRNYNEPVVAVPDVGAIISWRKFFEIARNATRNGTIDPPSRSRIFSIANSTKETWACFALEVWLSEWYDKNFVKIVSDQVDTSADRNKVMGFTNKKTILRPSCQENSKAELDFRNLLSGGTKVFELDQLLEPTNPNIEHKYPDGFNALFRAAILIAAHVDISLYTDNSAQTMNSAPENAHMATASRVWYKTSADCFGEFDPNNPISFRGLPGHFSTRGDYFLAVASGSQSMRLGYRVLDLMSSITSNVERAKMGIGLSSRRIHDTSDMDSCLWQVDPNTNIPTRMKLNKIVDLGQEKLKHFHWLWRSAIPSYEAHQLAFHRFNFRLFTMLDSYRSRHRNEWIRGITLYDSLKRGQYTPGELPAFYKRMSADYKVIVASFIDELDSITMRS